MKDTNEAILEDVDGFIIVQARKLMGWHLIAGHAELDTLEVDELIQRVRIKLWKMLEKGPILHPYSYARRIVYSEFIDMKRQQKQLLPLPDEENDGFYPLKSHMADPADEVIQSMEVSSLLQQLAQMLMDLPPRQQTAMICHLYHQVDDLGQLRSVLTKYGLDRKMIEWPEEKTARRTLLASLLVARQKLVHARQTKKVWEELA
ncbi:MAG: sigma-70 family RNA polymerase sigma factor [Ktedonobacteraceae bacterium]|nr:sigma-70 family RNA polymerase sigma factor [Ktedonobacteraceae bacterium]